MITEQENRIRNKFFEEKGIKAYKGHINDGGNIVWKEEYVKWLESKLSQHDVSNRRKLLIAFADAINICDGDKEKIGKLVDLYLKSN